MNQSQSKRKKPSRRRKKKPSRRQRRRPSRRLKKRRRNPRRKISIGTKPSYSQRRKN